MRTTPFRCCLILVFTGTGSAYGHTVTQKVGGYTGSDGGQRSQIGLGMVVETGAASTLTSSQLSINIAEERLFLASEGDEEPGNKEQRHSFDIAHTQIWDKLTETSILASGSRGEDVKNRTVGVGAKQWFHHETFRYGIDLSRTVVEQPYSEVLDYDSQVLMPPPVGESVGVNLSLRHLASSTTMIDYSMSHIAQQGRPPSYAGGVAVRQFVEATNGALHVNGVRAINRGYIGTETVYGQVDAWTAETAYVQNLWSGGLARLGYRYYREVEITRAYQDRLQLGTDAVSFGFSQEINDQKPGSTPMTVEAASSRILTNTDLAVTTFEAGLTAKF